MSILPLSTLRGPSPWTVPAVPEHENSPELSTPPEDLHDRLWLVRLRQPAASRTAATPAAAVNHRVPNLRIIPPHPFPPLRTAYCATISSFAASAFPSFRRLRAMIWRLIS